MYMTNIKLNIILILNKKTSHKMVVIYLFTAIGISLVDLRHNTMRDQQNKK